MQKKTIAIDANTTGVTIHRRQLSPEESVGCMLGALGENDDNDDGYDRIAVGDTDDEGVGYTYTVGSTLGNAGELLKEDRVSVAPFVEEEITSITTKPF
jgi:hypothetical protein